MGRGSSHTFSTLSVQNQESRARVGYKKRVENEELGDWTPDRSYRSRQLEEKYSLVCKVDGVEPKQLMLCDEAMFCPGVSQEALTG